MILRLRLLLTSLLFCMVLSCFGSVPVMAASCFCRDDLKMDEFFIVGPNFYNPTSQGMCLAGKYIIYTRFVNEHSPTVYVLIDKQTRKEVAHYSFNTEHSNSLTYNPDTGEVVAVTNSKAFVFSLKGSKLTFLRTHYLNHNCPKIAYAPDRKIYYLGTSNVVYSTKDFSSLHAEFHVPQLAVNQGMGYDGKFLYIPWYRVGHNTVCVYDLNGKEVRRYEFKSDTYREIEDIDFDGDTMFVNIANSPDHNGISTVSSLHKYGAWKKVKNETCGDPGMKERQCTLCHHPESAVIPPTGKHKPGKWEPTKSPTCTQPGGHLKRCTVCKHVVEEGTVPATGHSFTAWERISLPDVLHIGTDHRYCTKCHKEELRPVECLKPFVHVSENYVTLRKKTKTKLSCTFNRGDSIVSWASDNPDVATVKDGIVHGKSSGDCFITVKLKSGITKRIPVKVQILPVFTDDLIVYKVPSMKVGEKVSLSIQKVPSTAFADVHVSSDSNCVKIHGTTLQAVSKGTAKIAVKCWPEVRTFTVKVQ